MSPIVPTSRVHHSAGALVVLAGLALGALALGGCATGTVDTGGFGSHRGSRSADGGTEGGAGEDDPALEEELDDPDAGVSPDSASPTPTPMDPSEPTDPPEPPADPSQPPAQPEPSTPPPAARECCALCRNRTRYHQVNVPMHCTDAARAYCNVGDRGGLVDAMWGACAP